MPYLELHRDTRQNYDRLSRWYDSFSTSEERLTEIGLQLLSIQPCEQALEIGFGTGHSLVKLGRAVGEAGRVFGEDLSPGMVTVARQRVQNSGMDKRISLNIGDATYLPFRNNQFQVAFLSFTLELFNEKEIQVVLAECWRVLLPAGRLGIVSLLKKDTYPVKIYERFHRLFPKVVDCQPISVRPILEEARFEITKITEEQLWGLPVAALVAIKCQG